MTTWKDLVGRIHPGDKSAHLAVLRASGVGFVPPVDIRKVLIGLGVELSQEVRNGCRGFCWIRGPRARVSIGKTEATKFAGRFAAAHGLAHILLNHLQPPEDLLEEVDYRQGTHNLEANELAGELLVPTALLDWTVHVTGSGDMDALAKFFVVGESLVRYRLGFGPAPWTEPVG
jgi:Zn-dependent peptidase ImmA (M78 family)